MLGPNTRIRPRGFYFFLFCPCLCRFSFSNLFCLQYIARPIHTSSFFICSPFRHANDFFCLWRRSKWFVSRDMHFPRYLHFPYLLEWLQKLHHRPAVERRVWFDRAECPWWHQRYTLHLLKDVRSLLSLPPCNKLSIVYLHNRLVMIILDRITSCSRQSLELSSQLASEILHELASDENEDAPYP